MPAPGTFALTTVPANRARCEGLQVIFGPRAGDGSAGRCQCQRVKTPGRAFYTASGMAGIARRAADLREETQCGHPDAETTTGLVAYLAGEPVGWCAVQPRTAYQRLGRVPWSGRSEDNADPGVWAVPCFVTRAGYRRLGITYDLARAAV